MQNKEILLMSTLERPNIIQFISESATEELNLVLRGHLYLEALLNQIIHRSLQYPRAIDETRQSFYAKVKLLRALGKIDQKLEKLLLTLNSLRNKIAHQLRYEITFDDAFDLARIAAEAGIDFSDETAFNDRSLCEEFYGITGVLSETISNTFQDIVWQNENLFTKEEISDFIG